MPLMPTNQTEEKHPKSDPKSENIKDFHLKLKLLPSIDLEEHTPEYHRSQNIKFIILLIFFIILVVFLHLNRTAT